MTIQPTSLYEAPQLRVQCQLETAYGVTRNPCQYGSSAELIGSPLDVYERPATRFVAGFIGSPAMNFLTARLRSDGTSIEIPGGIHIPVDSGGLPDYGSKQVTFGIRPEHFELTEPKESAMLLRVNHVELLGADTLVHGHLGDEKTLLTARLPDIYHFKKGSTLSLTVSPQKMHLFDKNTGKRIEA